METERIYHIADATDWADAIAAGEYRISTVGRTLDDEGFIHCSTAAQVVDVANAIHAGRRGLLLLSIDPTLVRAEIRLEHPKGRQELFPHIYGPLNPDAVVEAIDFPPGPDGRFRFSPDSSNG